MTIADKARRRLEQMNITADSCEREKLPSRAQPLLEILVGGELLRRLEILLAAM